MGLSMPYVGMSYVYVGMSVNGECLFGLWACSRACLTSEPSPGPFPSESSEKKQSLVLSPGLDPT